MSPPVALPTLVPVAELKVNGSMVSSAVIADLLDVRVNLVLNGVSEATLRLYDADFEKVDSTTFEIGAAIEIGFAPAREPLTTVFVGEITAIGIEQGPTDLHELVITCFDKGHRLARSTAAKTYQQVTYSDVATQIAGAHGLSTDIASTFGEAVHPYLLQTSDDAAFLAEMARRTGHQWRVDGDTLKVFNGYAGQATHTLTWGEDLLRFRARVNGSPALDEIKTRAWDPLTKREIVGTAGNPNAELLNEIADIDAQRNKGKSIGGSPPTRTGTRQVFTSVDEANTVATAMRQEIAASVLQAKGECFGTATMAPGTKVVVTGAGTRMSGKYFLTAVEHAYSPKGYVTRFTAGPVTGSGVSDLLSIGGPPTTHLAPVIGIVTNNKDSRDGREGVVRVKFPTFGDNIESAWARVVALGAGATRGMQMLPAVNDEVLVVFEGGDYRRPLVIGGLWNGSDAPKIAAATTTKNGAVVQWAITTAKGQQLLFDDSTDASLNVLMTVDGQNTKLYLGKDKVELFSNQKTIEIKSGQADILLDGQRGDVTIKGTNVKIEATQSIKLTGNQSVEIVGQTQAKMSGTTVEVKGTAKTDVGGTGMTTIAGTPVKIN